ncbi:MAG: hypothetical protein ACRDDC_05415, partial [Tannerellaceae bacterium]
MEKKFNGSRYPVAALLSLSLLSVPMDMVATDVNITDHLAVGQSKSRIIEGIVKDDLGDVLPG